MEHDLPAALEAIATHSGYPRIHVLGHGLGGLLAIAAAGRRERRLASIVALGAPLALPEMSAEAAAVATLVSMLPRQFPLPVRALARLTAPLVGAGRAMFELAGQSPVARVRGAMMYAAEDPSVPLIRAVRSWLRSGTPTMYGGAIELCEGIASAEVPLLVVTGLDDPICPPDAGERALATWGHPDRSAVRASGSHLDLILGAQAPTAVFAPIARWLDARRRHAWADGPGHG